MNPYITALALCIGLFSGLYIGNQEGITEGLRQAAASCTPSGRFVYSRQAYECKKANYTTAEEYLR